MQIKQNIYILIIAASVIVLGLSSCKNDGDDPTPKTIIGKWKRTSGIYSPAFNGKTDWFTPLPACWKDDILEFSIPGGLTTATLTEGSITCEPTNAYSTTYNISNGNTLTINSLNTFEFEVDGNTLTLISFFTEDGVDYTSTETYARQ
jgi:hypothetical protein